MSFSVSLPCAVRRVLCAVCRVLCAVCCVPAACWQGNAPTAELVHGALEVVVPIRDGADADAVLKVRSGWRAAGYCMHGGGMGN